jgi:pyruvate/2-oxoglutarate dehydrogenase complex dihydrolipoamide acyltransferase (E2) component
MHINGIMHCVTKKGIIPMTKRSYQVFRAPLLSPTMSHMKILSWNVSEGTEMSAYSLLCTVEAHNLTQTSYSTEAPSVMELEIVDELILHKILKQSNSVVNVSEPLAVFLETDEEPPEDNGFQDLRDTQDVVWQAYVKNSDDEGSCGTC